MSCETHKEMRDLLSRWTVLSPSSMSDREIESAIIDIWRGSVPLLVPAIGEFVAAIRSLALDIIQRCGPILEEVKRQHPEWFEEAIPDASP